MSKIHGVTTETVSGTLRRLWGQTRLGIVNRGGVKYLNWAGVMVFITRSLALQSRWSSHKGATKPVTNLLDGG